MREVNYITHLNGVLRKFFEDDRITTSHRSLYLPFFELWNQKHFPNTIMVRKQVMSLAKLRSRTTYHKLLRDLKTWGYLQYHPSTNPQNGSLVDMFRFDTPTVQKMVAFNKEKNKQIINSLKQTIPENEQVVLGFFKKECRSVLEARRFYNFYEAIGWKVGPNPIINWQACALSWILKADEINDEKRSRGVFQNQDNLHTNRYKNYAEPL